MRTNRSPTTTEFASSGSSVRARAKIGSRSSAGGSGIGWWSRPASAIICAAEAGAVTTTSSLFLSRAWAKGIRGPKCPAPARVLIKMRIGEQDVPGRRTIPERVPVGGCAAGRAIPMPAASNSTSSGEPWRPSTNVWWNSSVAAYASVIATAGHGLRSSSARYQRNHSSPYSAMWAALRRIVSHTPSPVPRSGCGREEEDDAHQHERRAEPKEQAHRPVMVAG